MPAKGTAGLYQRHYQSHPEGLTWGDVCYLTVSMCLCDGQLRRGGVEAFAMDTVEELIGVLLSSVLGSRPCTPRKSKHRLTWDISPSQALTWQARFSISFSCLELGPTIWGRLEGKVTGVLDLMEPPVTRACAPRWSLRKAICL